MKLSENLADRPHFLRLDGPKPKKKRKGIPKVSKRRKKELPIYAKLRKAFLATNSHCAVYPERRATEIHHRKGRVSGFYLDVATWLPVSAAGHRWIHANPKEAEAKGWLR